LYIHIISIVNSYDECTVPVRLLSFLLLPRHSLGDTTKRLEQNNSYNKTKEMH